jgi:hypothetical protein
VNQHETPWGSDGACTGFPDGIGPWNWAACCLPHDVGGSDGALVDCIAAHAPGLPIVVILAAVTLMALLRPLYNLGQRWGWWK